MTMSYIVGGGVVVPQVSAEQVFPIKIRRSSISKAGIHEPWVAVGGISIAFLHGTADRDEPCHIPVRILHSVQSLIERPVPVGISVPQNDIVDISIKLPPEVVL